MSALAVAPTGLDRGYGERALDDVIVRAWEELTAHRGTACPVCGGEMEPEYGAQARPIAGRCTSCRSTLS
jgi:hypothetical protein